MKKKELKKAFDQLTKEFNELKERNAIMANQSIDLRDATKKAQRFAEDLKYKLIKHTDLTLDGIMNLTEDEVNEKLMRGYQNNFCK